MRGCAPPRKGEDDPPWPTQPSDAAPCVAVLACCAPLLGCAGITGISGPSAALAPDRSGRFEGWYQGRQFPSSTNPHSACRSRAREVWFKVEDGNIEMRNNRHRRNRRKLSMLGTVSTDGSVAMRQGEGGRSVVGRIQNDRLTRRHRAGCPGSPSGPKRRQGAMLLPLRGVAPPRRVAYRPRRQRFRPRLRSAAHLIGCSARVDNDRDTPRAPRVRRAASRRPRRGYRMGQARGVPSGRRTRRVQTARIVGDVR